MSVIHYIYTSFNSFGFRTDSEGNLASYYGLYSYQNGMSFKARHIENSNDNKTNKGIIA